MTTKDAIIIARQVGRFADSLFALVDESRAWRVRVFPLDNIRPRTISHFTNIREEFDTVAKKEFQVYGYELPTDKPPLPDLKKLIEKRYINDVQVAIEEIVLDADQNIPADMISREFKGPEHSDENPSVGKVLLYWMDNGGNSTGVGESIFTFTDQITAEDAPGPLQNLRPIREEFEEEETPPPADNPPQE